MFRTSHSVRDVGKWHRRCDGKWRCLANVSDLNREVLESSRVLRVICIRYFDAEIKYSSFVPIVCLNWNRTWVFQRVSYKDLSVNCCAWLSDKLEDIWTTTFQRVLCSNLTVRPGQISEDIENVLHESRRLEDSIRWVNLKQLDFTGWAHVQCVRIWCRDTVVIRIDCYCVLLDVQIIVRLPWKQLS